VEHGADINKKKNDGLTLLFNACLSRNENIVKCLVEHGADINHENKYGITPIFNACLNKNVHLVEYSIEHGADINKATKKNGKTPLFDACMSRNENIVKCLVEFGADINKENINGDTPLFNACLSKNVRLVDYLLEHEADINKATRKFGILPLYDVYEYQYKNKTIVKFLVKHGLSRDYYYMNKNVLFFDYLYDHDAYIHKVIKKMVIKHRY